MAAASRPMSRLVGHGCELRPNTSSDCVKMFWILHSPAISAARAFLPLHFGRQMTRRTSFAWGKCPTVSTFHTVCRSTGRKSPVNSNVRRLDTQEGTDGEDYRNRRRL